ncbi:unnamed protein product [Trifolium pratense]|uniref:Uncharacterized protein n=1 Tax=Trifolium pratense TaxID=57577 RepID=A0ACB0LUZ2_TRIPR|nr:unnamed protein product [Trifolium pratense]
MIRCRTSSTTGTCELKIKSFLSFQIAPTTTCHTARRPLSILPLPLPVQNLRKISSGSLGTATSQPNHLNTLLHRDEAKAHHPKR